MSNLRIFFTLLLGGLFFNQTNAQNLNITPWTMHEGRGHLKLADFPEVGKTRLSEHGDPAAYKIAKIPNFTDAGWKLAKTDSKGAVNFSKTSSVPCFTAVDFTYFKTEVIVPTSYNLNKLTVNFLKADDGARFYVFNSMHPTGVYPPGKDLKLGKMNNVAIDLTKYIVPGKNTIVVVQFDDCATGNNVYGIEVKANGKVVETSDPCTALESLDPKYSQYMEIGDFLTVGEYITSANGKYRFIVPDDSTPPRIEEIKIIECKDAMCEPEKVSVVKTKWNLPSFKRNWTAPQFTAFVLQRDCNFAYSTPNKNFWNPTDGRDKNKGLLNNCSRAELTNNGDLVLLGKDGKTIMWSSAMGSNKALGR